MEVPSGTTHWDTFSTTTTSVHAGTSTLQDESVQTGRESNPGEGVIFRTRPDRPWGPPSLLYDGHRVSFPGVKRPRGVVNHPPPTSAEVKEKVELYLYSPCVFVVCSRVNFTFYLFHLRHLPESRNVGKNRTGV